MRPSSVGEHETRYDVHCHQLKQKKTKNESAPQYFRGPPSGGKHNNHTDLLEEQFSGIRNRQLCHLLGALAVRAPPVVPHQPALLACVHLELVRRNHQPFKQQLRRAVSNQTVALHLSESQPAFARPSLRRLPGQRCPRAPAKKDECQALRVVGVPLERTSRARASCP